MRSSSLEDGFVKVMADVVAVTVSSISSLGFSGDVAVSVPENFLITDWTWNRIKS